MIKLYKKSKKKDQMNFYGRIRQNQGEGLSKESLEKMQIQQKKNTENFEKMVKEKGNERNEQMIEIQKDIARKLKDSKRSK